MIKTVQTAATAIVLLLAPVAAASAQQLKVVASFSIIADFARNVGGNRVDIITLVGPDGDAHVYEPKPADAGAMAKADVILVNGLHFEGFLERLVKASGARAPVIELAEGVETIAMKEPGNGHSHSHSHSHDGEVDPHAFQSIGNARLYVGNIAKAFCAADTEGCPVYEANADVYRGELENLEREVMDMIGSIPEQKRTIISSHDAFGYFEHEYGLTFRAPEGISTDADPSAADVARLINDVRREEASAIFIENITNPRLIEQIAKETGLQVGGALYSDALSDSNGPAPTYIDMMRHNITVIRNAITGS
jgi:zinc/manganese transport system substrate-binding protein